MFGARYVSTMMRHTVHLMTTRDYVKLREPIQPMLYAIGRNLPPNSVALALKLDGDFALHPKLSAIHALARVAV